MEIYHTKKNPGRNCSIVEVLSPGTAKKEIQVSLYNDFCISLEEIFKDLF